MKATRTLLLTSALLAASAFSVSAQTVALVTNTNSSDITSGQNPYVSQINAGQTLYVGIPYSGGSWQLSQPTDFFSVNTWLLAEGGSSSASFNFYTATDTGSGLTGISALTGVTAGSASIAAGVSTNPTHPGNISAAGVTATLDYNNTSGDPFASSTGGITWLGITNTGSNTLTYYTGNPFGGGTPAPEYSFGSPFNTGGTSLLENTYTYNGNGSLGAGNQNVHPYLGITATAIPEPSTYAAMLGGASMLLAFGRRLRKRRMARASAVTC